MKVNGGNRICASATLKVNWHKIKMFLRSNKTTVDLVGKLVDGGRAVDGLVDVDGFVDDDGLGDPDKVGVSA